VSIILLRSHGYSSAPRDIMMSGYAPIHGAAITHKFGVLDKCAEMRISYKDPSSKRKKHNTSFPERTEVKVMITCDNIMHERGTD
jgi:hypothetical protein